LAAAARRGGAFPIRAKVERANDSLVSLLQVDGMTGNKKTSLFAPQKSQITAPSRPFQDRN
jgi:hypothetical protein